MPRFRVPPIKYIQKILPDCFHGTDIASYKSVCNDGFHHSTGPEQFLGDGVYFWEGSELLAVRWAIKKTKRARAQTYVVIQATIDLGYCLDLTKPEHLEIVEEAAQKLKAETPSYVINDPVVINFIDYAIQKLDTIRSINPKSKKLIFKGSRFLSNVEPIICVRNTENILYFELSQKDKI